MAIPQTQIVFTGFGLIFSFEIVLPHMAWAPSLPCHPSYSMSKRSKMNIQRILSSWYSYSRVCLDFKSTLRSQINVDVRYLKKKTFWKFLSKTYYRTYTNWFLCWRALFEKQGLKRMAWKTLVVFDNTMYKYPFPTWLKANWIWKFFIMYGY